jgi:transcriptional regulator with XRE-family HTH domain
MSADYYSRIEQQRGSRPSEPMLAAIARGLHLSLDERDHLFRLAGHPTPARELRLEHVDAGLMRVLDRLQDTPAQVVTSLGETLLQTPPAVALLGDETAYTGPDRSMVYRWFTRPDVRQIYPAEDHDMHSRTFTATPGSDSHDKLQPGLHRRPAVGRRPPRPREPRRRPRPEAA